MSAKRDRCNCDASCGENRYHDRGESGCVWNGIPRDLWEMDISHARLALLNERWESELETRNIGDKRIEKMTGSQVKIKNKLSKVSESFTINMYDNGFMVEVSGKDSKDDWKTSKIMVNTVDELLALVREATELERDS